MKRQFLAIAAVAASLAGCTSKLEPATEPEGEGIFATIEQPALPIQTKTLSWDTDKLKFTWGTNENVVVFGREGNKGKADAALLRTLTAGEASSKLESKGFQLMDGINYYAFIPAYNFNITTDDITNIPLTFEGQRQGSSNTTSHLKYYDYACATATKAEGSNSLEFKLQNQVGWIVLEHLFTEDTKGVTSLTLSTEEKLFTSSCKLDATSAALKYNKLSSILTLNLGTANGSGLDFAKGEYLRAFFTTAPVDLSGKELTVTAHKADGTSVELMKKASSNCNLEKNSTVVIRTSDATAATIATLGDRQFSSLEDAIAAAEKYGKQATITLASNVKGSFSIANTMNIGKEIILDLNGHSITAENDKECAIIVKQGDVRLKNGTLESKKYAGVKFDPQAKGARVYLVNCTVNSDQGAVCTSTATGCQIVIYGGSFTATNNAVIAGNGSPKYAGTQEARDKGNTITISADSKGNIPVFNGYTKETDYIACGLYSPWKDVITINAAKFNIENGVGILSRGGQITVNDAEISVTGGDRVGKVADANTDVPCKTFYIDRNCNYPDIANADIDIKGGKYSDNAGESYVADNTYSYVEIEEDPFSYKVVTNETKLTEAVANVEKDGTVIINYPVSPRNQLKIQKDFTLTLAEGANIHGDCKSPVLHFCQDGGNNTINGKGNIYGADGSDAAILVNGKGQTLTIDCNNESDLQITGGSSSNFASAITIWDGKLVINNGTFISGTDASGNDSPAIYLMPMDQYDAPELEINGGVFMHAQGGSAKFLINCYDDDIARCKITIKGGTFVGFNPAASTGDTIGGKPANWVAEGYESVESTEDPGFWIVREK